MSPKMTQKLVIFGQDLLKQVLNTVSQISKICLLTFFQCAANYIQEYDEVNKDIMTKFTKEEFDALSKTEIYKKLLKA